jgi:uncharacterized protein
VTTTTIGIFINTPAQAHFYKNIAKVLQEEGNEVYLLARDYGETKNVLDDLHIEYHLYSKAPDSKSGKILSLPPAVFNAFNYLRKKNVNLITGFGVYDAFTAKLLRVPAIIFNDSEPAINGNSYSIQFKLFLPLVDAIVTPTSFRQDLGEKHIKINSFKELAYLHPKYYEPNSDIFKLLGLENSDEYVLLRFNAFDAVHDLNIKGFSNIDKLALVEKLEKYARVFISSEAKLPRELEPYLIKIPKSRIHDAISFAKLFVTDTQTMTTEAALLGTPTIRCNTFVGNNDMGNFVDLEKNYHLIYNFSDPYRAIDKAVELIQINELKNQYKEGRKRLLEEKIDIVKFMSCILNDYPQTLEKCKRSRNDLTKDLIIN